MARKTPRNPTKQVRRNERCGDLFSGPCVDLKQQQDENAANDLRHAREVAILSLSPKGSRRVNRMCTIEIRECTNNVTSLAANRSVPRNCSTN
mmetsp:Transcript_2357/g.4927  ORF Transcript_2357/g.4927 Transcript_2357/m.4927 type:complete len:93 (+) Transcript_2357:329-607(+)